MGRTEPAVTQPPAQQSERTFIGQVKDIGREVGDHLIDRANPLTQIQNQVRAVEQRGRSVADGVSALQNVLSRQNEIERTRRAPTLDDSSRAGVERLQQSAGFDPVREARDGFERLSSVPGLEGDEPSADVLGKTAPELTPALEPEVEEHVQRGSG